MFTIYKNFSDLDVHIRDPLGAYVTAEEVQDLRGLLANDPDVAHCEQGSKAIRSDVFGVETDVVCADLFDDGSQMHRSDGMHEFETLYEDYPGARNAARVAKWLFRDMRGVDVEYLVNVVAGDSRNLSQKTDPYGWFLFEAVVTAQGWPEASSCVRAKQGFLSTRQPDISQSRKRIEAESAYPRSAEANDSCKKAGHQRGRVRRAARQIQADTAQAGRSASDSQPDF